MNKRDFYRQFRSLLPDTISETSIKMDDPETTTLLFIGFVISRMNDEAQTFYDGYSNDESGIDDSFNDFLISIVANKYQIEW